MVSDLYIRVIPGMIVLTTFILPVLLATLITTPPSNPSTFQQIAIQGGNWLLVIFAVFSLLTGELINLIREQWVPVPHIFRKIVYNETGDRNSLSFWQRRKSRVSEIDPNDYCLLLSWVIIAIQKFIQIDDYEFQWLLTENGKIKTSISEPDAGFLGMFREQMGLDPSFSDSRIIYHAMYSQLDGQMSSKTRRYRIAYVFFSNFRLSLIICMVVLGVHWIQGGLVRKYIVIISLVSLVIIYFTTRIISKSYTNIERLYIKSLVVDYLVVGRGREG